MNVLKESNEIIKKIFKKFKQKFHLKLKNILEVKIELT